MKIFIKARPNAKKEEVKRIDQAEGSFDAKDRDDRITLIVAVREPPADGKANRAIINAVAEYLKIPRSQIHIVSGHTMRNKVLEVDVK
jgi:uncharacterized protein YggU (UPF0235/DUF167 family)